MPYGRGTIGGVALDTIVATIGDIYRTKDELRSLWDVWLHANHHAAAISEEVRKGNFGPSLIEEIAHFAVWLFTVAHKLRGEIGVPKSSHETHRESVIRIHSPLSDIIWNKYPAICPLCYWRRSERGTAIQNHVPRDDPCDCFRQSFDIQGKAQRRARAAALRAFAAAREAQKPASIDGWQQMLAKVFHDNLQRLELTAVALHLLEELGEASDAMARMYTYRDESFVDGEPAWRQVKLEDEIADLTSQLFALVEKLDLSQRQLIDAGQWRIDEALSPLRLSQIVWHHYGSPELQGLHCPFCRSAECACPIILIPETNSVDELRRKVLPVL